MEIDNNKNCSSKEHTEIKANKYCNKCGIYMCNKCESFHLKLFGNHRIIDLNKNNSKLYNEYCEEENHSQFKLKYFCKTHNKLCCVACIAKLKGKGDGQHIDCNICFIDEIKNEKKMH